MIDSHTRPGGNRKVWAFDVDDDGSLAASGWSSTSARAAAATACGSTSAATSGSPPGSSSPATPARPPTCRPASTSSPPAASCSADPHPRRRLHQPGLRRPRPQDAPRHLGQDRLQGPARRLGICPLPAEEGVRRAGIAHRSVSSVPPTQVVAAGGPAIPDISDIFPKIRHPHVGKWVGRDGNTFDDVRSVIHRLMGFPAMCACQRPDK